MTKLSYLKLKCNDETISLKINDLIKTSNFVAKHKHEFMGGRRGKSDVTFFLRLSQSKKNQPTANSSMLFFFGGGGTRGGEGVT